MSSLCDVGSLISSADVKMTIETWRTVAKLGDKLHNCPKTIIKTDNYDNSNEKYWQEKAILGLFKEVHEILNYYKKVIRTNICVNFSKNLIFPNHFIEF